MGGDHQCPVCQATFTRPQHVARHMRSHTGDRPYKCTYCGDQFARSDLLSRHVNKCHANERPPPAPPGSRRKGTTAVTRATTSKQACDQCVQASTPCDGANPCAKCVHRKCRCTFVKFHRQTAPVGPGHNPPNTTSITGPINGSSRLPPFADEFLPSHVGGPQPQSHSELYPPFYSFHSSFAEPAHPQPNGTDPWFGWTVDPVLSSVPSVPSTTTHQRYASNEFPPQSQFNLHPPVRRRASFDGGALPALQSPPPTKPFNDDVLRHGQDLTTLQQQQRLLQQQQQRLLEEQLERQRHQGEAFSSAFGLLSIEDPNVLAGLATDGTPFFSSLPPTVNNINGRHVQLPSINANSLSDPVSTPRPSTSGSTASTSTEASSGTSATSHSSSSSLSGALLPPLSGRENEVKELRAFWKAYMRTPGTPMSSSILGGPTPGPAPHITGALGEASYRRTRVASFPSATPSVERHGFVGPGAAGGTYTGMGEDLTSYEAAVKARGAPPALTLMPKRKSGVIVSSSSTSTSPTNNASSINGGGGGGSPSSSRLSLETPRPMAWEPSSYQFPNSTSISHSFSSNSATHQWRHSSPGGSGISDSENEDTGPRPSFKRLPSQTLEQASIKRSRDVGGGTSSDADHDDHVSYPNPAKGPEWGTERWGDWDHQPANQHQQQHQQHPHQHQHNQHHNEVAAGGGREHRSRRMSAPTVVSPGPSPILDGLGAQHAHRQGMPVGYADMDRS